ncbi:uncharacterized protein LOC108808454 [Raphanus sativus]|uniref:Uncharacterized protein LOC108808454 n=1 Tax=Raphanus sativus TaxID=3726 RepID=A0A9W3BVN1_RAPSA|nr:uncharacterized protein LOC108808454 [Raphanus sativus]
MIREIRRVDGSVVNTHSEIKQEAVNFFSAFLNRVPGNLQSINMEEMQSLLGFRCSEEESRMLEEEVSGEEIRKVVFAMPNNKSPGPDGYSIEFFKTTWPVVAHDFTIAVQSVLSLVVSELMANRLKKLLPQIIAENQSAFVKGRLLMENVLLASELVKDYHRESISPRCVMKIDISKAFDSVNWEFVLKILEALGFSAKFIHLIGLCIMTPSFSVQVNGDLSDDLMVFVEGSKQSIQGALSVFDEFEGPMLKSSNAKVAWKDICCKKNERGLGIRNLREVNKVYGLKLIWRMLSGSSLWGEWIKANLLKGKSFWEVNLKMQNGSWMWHKMLKLRSVAKLFYKVEVGNGRSSSFGFDHWSEKGVLSDLLGDRGITDMGLCKNATVEEAVLQVRRRRRHRSIVLNEIEEEINFIKNNFNSEKEDTSLWRRDSGYKKDFSTQETWNQLRDKKTLCEWALEVWFSQATPKYAFMAWLAVLNRMSTMDRVVKWSQAQVWEFIAKGLLCNSYTTVWSEIIAIISDKTREKKNLLCIRYAFQAVLYALWRERNKLKHGEKGMSLDVLRRVIEKGIHNRISLIRKSGTKGMEELMIYWFNTR